MSYIKSVLKGGIRGIQTAEAIICSIGLILCTSFIFIQVLNRYWLHFPIMWLSDLALYCFIFFMLIAAALTTWNEGHIAMDYFHDKAFNGKPRGVAIHHASMVIIAIALVVIFLPQAYKFLLKALKYPQYGTIVCWFNTSWLQMTLFVALVLVLIHLVVIMRRDTGNAIKTWHSRSRK